MAQSSSSNPEDNGLVVVGYNGYYENVDDYRKGGNHPIHLGSRVANYEFVAKLAALRQGLQWLCVDVETKKYISLLILKADVDVDNLMEMKYLQKNIEGVVLPMNQFKINGPNGSHHVLVCIPLGTPFETDIQQDKQKLKSMCLQTTRILANLHSNGICHGHVTPYNIFAIIEGLDSLSKGDVRAQIGHLIASDLVRVGTQEPHGLDSAPRKVYSAINWGHLKQGSIHLSSDYRLVLRTAYEQSSPPKALTLPLTFAPPEYILEGSVGAGSDIWALGCTIYRCRTGEMLFGGGDDDPGQAFFEICLRLGKPPGKWWNKWEEKNFYFKDDNLALTPEFGEVTPRSIRAEVERTFALQSQEPRPEPFTPEESELFVDLLESIFKYDPASRPSMATIVEHGWFKSE